MKKDLSEAALERCVEQLKQMGVDRAKAIGFRPTYEDVHKHMFEEVIICGTSAAKWVAPYRLYPVNFLCDRITKQINWRKNRSIYLRRRRGY